MWIPWFILIAAIYAFLILYAADFTGTAAVYWPWKEIAKIETPEKLPLGPGIEIDLSEKILSSAILIRDFRDSHRSIERIELARPEGASAKSAEFETALREAKGRELFTYRIYHNHLESTAKKYTPKDQKQSLALLKARYGTEEAFQPLVKFAELFVAQSDAYRQNNKLEDKVIIRDMLKEDLGVVKR